MRLCALTAFARAQTLARTTHSYHRHIHHPSIAVNNHNKIQHSTEQETTDKLSHACTYPPFFMVFTIIRRADNYTHLSYRENRAKNLSVPSKSLPKLKSKTALFPSGFVSELETPSGDYYFPPAPFRSFHGCLQISLTWFFFLTAQVQRKEEALA